MIQLKSKPIVYIGAMMYLAPMVISAITIFNLIDKFRYSGSVRTEFVSFSSIAAVSTNLYHINIISVPLFIIGFSILIAALEYNVFSQKTTRALVILGAIGMLACPIGGVFFSIGAAILYFNISKKLKLKFEN